MAYYYMDFSLEDTGHIGTELDPWSYYDYLAARTLIINTGDTIYITGTRYVFDFSPEISSFAKQIIFDKWGSDPWRLYLDVSDDNSLLGIAFRNCIISTSCYTSLLIGGAITQNIVNAYIISYSESVPIQILYDAVFKILGSSIKSVYYNIEIVETIAPTLEVIDSTFEALDINCVIIL